MTYVIPVYMILYYIYIHVKKKTKNITHCTKIFVRKNININIVRKYIYYHCTIIYILMFYQSICYLLLYYKVVIGLVKILICKNYIY